MLKKTKQTTKKKTPKQNKILQKGNFMEFPSWHSGIESD